MRKTPAELISQLEEEASKYEQTAVGKVSMGIAVRKADEIYGGAIVWREHETPLAWLESLMRCGGEPIGLALVVDKTSTGGGLSISSSLYEEYASDVRAQSDLSEICEDLGLHLRDQLSFCGDAKIVAPPQ